MDRNVDPLMPGWQEKVNAQWAGVFMLTFSSFCFKTHQAWSSEWSQSFNAFFLKSVLSAQPERLGRKIREKMATAAGSK